MSNRIRARYRRIVTSSHHNKAAAIRCYAEVLSRHPLFKPYLALLAVCFFWGTTYLGIRMALESFPPMLLVCVRYIISGSILLVFARVRGLYLPQGKELAWACFSGLLTLGIGNAALV